MPFSKYIQFRCNWDFFKKQLVEGTLFYLARDKRLEGLSDQEANSAL